MIRRFPLLVQESCRRKYQHRASGTSPFDSISAFHHRAVESLFTRFNPSDSANTSILTIFDPVLEGKHDATPQSSYFEIILIKMSGIMFTKGTSGRICREFTGVKDRIDPPNPS